jgi:hypothetical protein
LSKDSNSRGSRGDLKNQLRRSHKNLQRNNEVLTIQPISDYATYKPESKQMLPDLRENRGRSSVGVHVEDNKRSDPNSRNLAILRK